MVGIHAGGLGAGCPPAHGRVAPLQHVGDAGLVEGLELALALLFEEERLVELLPDADQLVVRAGDDELAVVADGERPDFAVVALQLLDVLEL